MTNNLESKGDVRLAYSVQEAAEMLGVSRAWIYGLWADGAGPKRTKIAGRTLILKDDLRSWLGAAHV